MQKTAIFLVFQPVRHIYVIMVAAERVKMFLTDTTKNTVAAGADHMKNTVPASKPYTTAKPDTFRQKSQAAAGGRATSTQDKPREIKLLPRTPWTPMTPGEKKEVLRICEELATFPELTSDEEEQMEAAMAQWC